jgi:hypothetical protein
MTGKKFWNDSFFSVFRAAVPLKNGQSQAKDARNVACQVRVFELDWGQIHGNFGERRPLHSVHASLPQYPFS